MKAFILAAGLGTRLRPLTDTIPKAMAPVAPGLPILEHHVRHLRSQGIREFVVNLHHLPERITEHFGDGSRFGVRIEYSDERSALLDTAGALKKAAPLLDDDFVLIYGDQLHFYDLRPLIEAFNTSRAVAALMVKRSDLPQNGDVVDLDLASNRVRRWLARPHAVTELAGSLYLNAGLYVLSRALIDRIPEGRPVSLDREILPAAVERGDPIYAYPGDQDILDIGTPEKLAYAQTWYSEQTARRRRALFLDRDGVIVRALPRGEYLTDWSQTDLMDGIQSLVSSARAAGYLTVVVTNQPQVSRGLLSEGKLREIHDRMEAALGGVDAIYYCPHTDEDACNCRKPKNGMLLRGSQDVGSALDQSIFVGDSDRDVLAGSSAGCRTVFIRNEYNGAEAVRCSPEFIVNHLSEIEPLL